MKKELIALLCAAELMAGMFAGCAGNPAVDGAMSSQAQPETELVPVLDEQYADILNDYHIVGQFHDGVAFAARLLYLIYRQFLCLTVRFFLTYYIKRYKIS